MALCGKRYASEPAGGAANQIDLKHPGLPFNIEILENNKTINKIYLYFSLYRAKLSYGVLIDLSIEK